MTMFMVILAIKLKLHKLLGLSRKHEIMKRESINFRSPAASMSLGGDDASTYFLALWIIQQSHHRLVRC